MKLFGIIGFPLEHSFSKRYFDRKIKLLGLDQHLFNVFPLKDIEELPHIISHHPEMAGLAVTIPHKSAVIPYLKHIDLVASSVGAVNCIQIKNGVMTGYNTDIIGFEASITPALQHHHQRALILGSGGASLAVRFVLKKIGIPFQIVSRVATQQEGWISYDALSEEIISQHQLIINCTPLGTFPDIEQKPDIPYQWLTPQHLLFDMVYNPEITAFMKEGMSRGATVLNGMKMLEIQAEANWKIWNSH